MLTGTDSCQSLDIGSGSKQNSVVISEAFASSSISFQSAFLFEYSSNSAVLIAIDVAHKHAPMGRYRAFALIQICTCASSTRK